MRAYALSKKLEIKENYAIVHKEDCCYLAAGYAKNSFVDTLQYMFVYYGADIIPLVLALLDPKGKTPLPKGYNVTIIGEDAMVECLSLQEDNPGKGVAVEVDRVALGHMLYKWMTFKMEDITPVYIYYKDGEYGVSDVMPEGLD